MSLPVAPDDLALPTLPEMVGGLAERNVRPKENANFFPLTASAVVQPSLGASKTGRHWPETIPATLRRRRRSRQRPYRGPYRGPYRARRCLDLLLDLAAS